MVMIFTFGGLQSYEINRLCETGTFWSYDCKNLMTQDNCRQCETGLSLLFATVEPLFCLAYVRIIKVDKIYFVLTYFYETIHEFSSIGLLTILSE